MSRALAHLDVDETRLLAECERIIDAGIKAFCEMGKALVTIRDRKLYRETHGTYEDYCKDRWGIEERMLTARSIAIELMLFWTGQVCLRRTRGTFGLYRNLPWTNDVWMGSCGARYSKWSSFTAEIAINSR